MTVNEADVSNVAAIIGQYTDADPHNCQSAAETILMAIDGQGRLTAGRTAVVDEMVAFGFTAYDAMRWVYRDDKFRSEPKETPDD